MRFKLLFGLFVGAVSQGFAIELPSVSKVGVGYYQYMNHWTGAEKQSFLWKERDSLSRDDSPGQSLKIIVADLEFKLPFNTFFKIKSGYHFNSVQNYDVDELYFPVSDEPREVSVNGFEDVDLSFGYDWGGHKISFKYISPLIQTYEPLGGSFADAWAGFHVNRLGLEYETVAYDTWFDVQGSYILSESEFARVKTGGFDLKAMGFRGVELAKNVKAHYGLITSYQSYEWYKYNQAKKKRALEGRGALQREYQIEPHFGVGLNAMGLEYKIDLAFTLYSATYTEFEGEEFIVYDESGAFIAPDDQIARPMSEWTDAPRQLIFGLSINKYF